MNTLYYLALGTLIICAGTIIPNLLVLSVSRFLLGVFNAFQMSISSAYIKETFPAHIRKPLGAIYSSSRIFGMLLCYLIA